MKTFNQKMVFGIIGTAIGGMIGFLVGAFVAGTLDPFAMRFYWSDDSRNTGLEGFARLGWVILTFGGAAGMSSFAVYLVGKK